MALSFGIQHFILGGVIAAIMLLNIVIGYISQQELSELCPIICSASLRTIMWRKTIMSLLELSAPVVKVLHEGQISTVRWCFWRLEMLCTPPWVTLSPPISDCSMA